MGYTGNFGSVALEGDDLAHVRALGNSIEIPGCEAASLHIAIVQGDTIVHGAAQTSGGNWTTDPPLDAKGLQDGDALGLACQTLVTVSDGTLPSFVTFTWSEQVSITKPSR
jgi:hypothetical protein